MAEQDINLLPEAENQGSKVQTRFRQLTIVNVIVLASTLVIFGLIFLLSTRSSQQLNALKEEKKPLEEQIQGLSTKEGLIRVIAAKADAVQSIFNAQPKFKDIVSKLIALQANGVSYTEITLTAPDKVLVSGRANSLDTLESFLAELTGKEYQRKVFSDIVLQSLTRNDRGEFEFSLRFVYVEGNQ